MDSIALGIFALVVRKTVEKEQDMVLLGRYRGSQWAPGMVGDMASAWPTSPLPARPNAALTCHWPINDGSQ